MFQIFVLGSCSEILLVCVVHPKKETMLLIFHLRTRVKEVRLLLCFLLASSSNVGLSSIDYDHQLYVVNIQSEVF